uniref:Uncharacterized protein n=1 Tax=Romanomermis culicivorax TaxID=13658 RepID=A0A915JZ95_ROMCU
MMRVGVSGGQSSGRLWPSLCHNLMMTGSQQLTMGSTRGYRSGWRIPLLWVEVRNRNKISRQMATPRITIEINWGQQLHASPTTLINGHQQLHALWAQLHKPKRIEKPLDH